MSEKFINDHQPPADSKLTKRQLLNLQNTNFSNIQVKFCDRKLLYYFVKKRTLCNPFKTKFKYYTWLEMERVLSKYGYTLDKKLFLIPFQNLSNRTNVLVNTDINGFSMEDKPSEDNVSKAKENKVAKHTKDLTERGSSKNTNRFYGEGDFW